MATNASLLDNEAFARLVAERNLRPYELGGYLYADYHGPSGIEIYRTYGPKWMNLYSARRIVTQNAVGGGALVIRISVPTGMVAKLVSLYVQGSASAGATLVVWRQDEDAAQSEYLQVIGAGASREASFPSIGGIVHQAGIHSKDYLIGPGSYLAARSSVAIQTETMTVAVRLLLPITAKASDIVWDTTGSAGTPALAASTISDANTLQAVLLP